MNDTAKLTGLAHIGIFTADLDASVAFYKQLGFKVDAECAPGPRLTFMSLGTCLLELICPPDPAALEKRNPNGWIGHVCIECHHIDEVVADFKARGIIPETAQVSYSDKILGGIKNIFFDGPSGEAIELFDYLKD